MNGIAAWLALDTDPSFFGLSRDAEAVRLGDNMHIEDCFLGDPPTMIDLHAPKPGPSRSVVEERVDGGTVRGPNRRKYIYTLDCGHIVTRSKPGRTQCYCEVCGS